MVTGNKIYEITSPNGKTERVFNIAEFGRDHGLNPHGLYPTAGTKEKTYKGYHIKIWRVRLDDRSKENFNLELITSQQRPRLCLKCQNKFLSKWIGNRICHHCKDTNRFLDPSMA